MQTDQTSLTAEAMSRETLSRYLWTAFIVGFFVIQAVIWTVAITVTTSDPSHAIVPGYDEKAVNWNEQLATLNASKALGWTASIEVDPVADIRGMCDAALTLVDRNGKPVGDATLIVEAFHRGRIAEAQNVEFTQVAPGVFTAKIRVRHNGKWQFRGSAKRGDDTFLIDLRTAIKVSGV